MASNVPTKRISLEDFRDAPKEVRPALEKLVFILNPFMTAVYDALAGALTAPENIAAQFRTLSIEAGAAAADNTAIFAHTLKTKPQACYVVAVQQVAGTTVPITSPVFVSWHVGTEPKTIEIDAISGLTAGETYTITLKVE
jgi:hypothetical protein